jgi:hypothetical protein
LTGPGFILHLSFYFPSTTQCFNQQNAGGKSLSNYTKGSPFVCEGGRLRDKHIEVGQPQKKKAKKPEAGQESKE